MLTPSGIVIFENEHGVLRIARAAKGLFELAFSVNGEEVTVYDLPADAIAAIGSKLLASVAASA
jgi:hypothetical protein